MKYRTQDDIVWDGFPHPDPRSRHAGAEASIRIAPSFWSRLGQHVRDARGCASARALWENWLTPEAAGALAAGATDHIEMLGTRGPRSTGIRGAAGDIPAVAVDRLRETIAASLETPLAMCFDTGATSSSRPTLYCLVLTNGATLTLRGNPTTLEAEDCFFSRAAVEATDDALPAGTFTGAEGDAFINGLNDLAGASALLCMGGGGAFQFLQAPAVPAPAGAGETAAATNLRAAVAREMVRRYAAVDESKQFVLPDGAATRGADIGCKRASFLQPQSWGFTAAGPGSRWTGVVGSIGSGHAVNGNSNHRAHRDANRNGNRMSLPGFPARMNGTSDNLPDPTPRDPAPARPASDRLLPTKQPGENPQNGVARADLTSNTERLERLAAYRAVVALGECRVFGFTEGPADAATAARATLVLPADLAITAAARLDERLARWTADAEVLRDRLLSAGGAAAEDLRLGLLESRMEAWAAYLTLDSSYTVAVDSADPDADRLSHAVDSILTRIEAFDEALQLCEPCLAISDDTPLLANWRKMLADAYRDTPPWWLERTPAFAAPQ